MRECVPKLCGLESSSVLDYYKHGSEFSDSKKDGGFFCFLPQILKNRAARS